ncbi:hypothetical protein PRIPAC_71805 [Pristionchus pacificus]|uniref:Uncharacterized protein n=1 Tax=Pristionchus pacificus TaxID=54126 RepID=A0A454Y334_PRIPA|nr:hypothetical protein PRIPAC_71805 [Pristionchus pacificus]|eukprot:PDM73487.1 hypothetical protein PRIPAC_40843 [Pristionchus pacificus]
MDENTFNCAWIGQVRGSDDTVPPAPHLNTASHNEYTDKLHRLAEHIRTHPEEARLGISKLSAAAQRPAGDIIKIFVSKKDVRSKYADIQNVKAGVTAPVRAEIDAHLGNLAHNNGILTLAEILQRLEALADWIRNHPDESRAKVATLSQPAQKPFGDMVKIFISDKTPREKHAEIRLIKESIPSEVLGEINALKEQIARKIGITPLHHQ